MCWHAVLLKLKLVLPFRRILNMLLVGNLPRYVCAKIINITWFDKVTAKIKWCSFFTHMIVQTRLTRQTTPNRIHRHDLLRHL